MTEIFIGHAEKYRSAENFEAALSAVPECRREGIERMKNPLGKQLLLATAAALSAALRSRGVDPMTADIRKKKSGKPYLCGSRTVFFSLSHSGTVGICAVSEKVNGVDIESTGRSDPGIASRFFTPRENKLLSACGDYDYYFTRLWTLKESFAKYTGEGISSISGIEFDLRVRPPRLVRPAIETQPKFFETTYGEYQIALCTDDGGAVEIREI